MLTSVGPMPGLPSGAPIQVRPNISSSHQKGPQIPGARRCQWLQRPWNPVNTSLVDQSGRTGGLGRIRDHVSIVVGRDAGPGCLKVLVPEIPDRRAASAADIGTDDDDTNSVQLRNALRGGETLDPGVSRDVSLLLHAHVGALVDHVREQE